jgi:hypothetical protein
MGFEGEVGYLPLGSTDAPPIETHRKAAAGEPFEISANLWVLEVRVQLPTPGPHVNQGRSGAERAVSDARAVGAGAKAELEVHRRQ